MDANKHTIIHQLFLYAAIQPHAIVFIQPETGTRSETRMSYSDLADRVRSVAAGLCNEGLEGKRVLLIYQETLPFIIAFLACLYNGIIPVPVSYVRNRRQLGRIYNILDDAGISAVLSTRDQAMHLKEGLDGWLGITHTPFIFTDEVATRADDAQAPAIVCSDIAFIQYTSGSTGSPKGVIISHDNLICNEKLIQHVFGCQRESVILCWLPFHHDMGLIGNILHTLYVGCSCVLMKPLDFINAPVNWLKAISNYRVTHSGGPNFAYDLCLDKIREEDVKELDLSSWQVAYNGSEPIRPATLQRFVTRFAAAGLDTGVFFPCYGLAEATLLVTAKKRDTVPFIFFIQKNADEPGRWTPSDLMNEQAQCLVSSGQTAPGLEIKIISPENGKECVALEEGEICIAGESVSSGYWNRDNNDLFYQLHGRSFFRTGDIGFLYEQELFVHGRLAEMLISRGRNIYPYDIELAIEQSHPAIIMNGVAVFSLDALKEEWAVVVEIKRALLKDAVAEMIVQDIDQLIYGLYGIHFSEIILTTPLGIPRTTSGKLKRNECSNHLKKGAFTVLSAKSTLTHGTYPSEGLKTPVLPLNGNMSRDMIVRYLSHVINIRTGRLQAGLINDQTQLTDIGVDSLRATEIINNINNDLGINIEMARVLHDNSFLGLASIIENMLWLKYDQTSGEEITI
ncbi:AMP-binding protein [Chitinophaga sp.]|uniref:AMP-binding protein n=1 Tax=Chitinophaga sp. TaxID=1869181 RepID=UPI0031E31009